MKTAFSTICCPNAGIDDVARYAESYEYDGVELYALDGDKLLPDQIRSRLPELQSALSNTDVLALNSWGVLVQSDADARAAQVAQITQAFELAEVLGCGIVKTFGGELPLGVTWSEAIDTASEMLTTLAGRAKDHGVVLVVETHDSFCRGEELASLIDRVEDPSIGALWDVFHPYRKGEKVKDTDALIGQRVRHVHVKDAVADGDGWKFVLAEKGELPTSEALKLLARRGFDGAVALDWELMWHPHIAGPDQSLPSFNAFLRKVFAEIEDQNGSIASASGAQS